MTEILLSLFEEIVSTEVCFQMTVLFPVVI